MPICICQKCFKRWLIEPVSDKTEFSTYCDSCRTKIHESKGSSELIVNFIIKAFVGLLFILGFGLILYGLWLYFREGIIFYIGIFLMLWANRMGRRIK
jgi:Flp pilus assembly protein TadB